ncbi:unnamed protein product [Brassicogethes aeneus]|uniref:Protein farnesyltransferase/geranylgeranyltransferase type-1 subunit alpha n=1 Tax=Brassicogethes aeneus TaxID=1431903 RepID=A0A9P0B2D0_BRAAE|nr:unnamed protein product [Brassicogethes aeneus]
MKMSDSSDEEQDVNYVLFKDRPDWKDIRPIEQDDDDEIVAIHYTDKFKDVHNYLRALLKKGEKSERALELTRVAASENPANYTVWQFRRDILKTLNKDLHEELDYIEKFILKQSKNYQVWHHRKLLVDWLKDPSKENYFTTLILNKDAKNYHAWQHRQWYMKTFQVFDGELDYVDSLLNDDVRNNSAWNQRYFVINNTTGFTEEVLKREIDYTLSKIKEVVENESAWNYLRGLLLHDKEGLSKNKTVTNFCEELYSSNSQSPFVLSLIVDMCCEQVQEGSGDSIYTLERALQLCSDLELKYDKIRANYWKHMADTIKRKASGENVEEEPTTS